MKAKLMMGNEINMRTVKESLTALHIQRRHKIDKDDRCTENTFFCSLAMDKTTTCFQTHPMADTGRCFCMVRNFVTCTSLRMWRFSLLTLWDMILKPRVH